MQRTEAQTPQRIAKLLARAGVASRREIERMIAEGRVALNGIVLDTPATTLPSLEGVTVDGEPVEAAEAARLFLFHKPPGYLTAATDPAGRKTIYDALPTDLPRLIPVGRLDLNTEGLLLLTTDGELKRQLELPATGVERSYRARAYGQVSQAQLEDLIDGIEIEGVRYGKIDANLERRTGANVWIEMTLAEGKNREVRRVLEHMGLRVSRLIRTRYGPFILADLPVGGIGEVRQHDLEIFRKTLKTPAAKRVDVDPVSVDASPAARPQRAATPERGRAPAPTARATHPTPLGHRNVEDPRAARPVGQSAAAGQARGAARSPFAPSRAEGAERARPPARSGFARPAASGPGRKPFVASDADRQRGPRSAARPGFAVPATGAGVTEQAATRKPRQAPHKPEIREELDTRPPRPERAPRGERTARPERAPRTASDTRPPRPRSAAPAPDDSPRSPRTKRPAGWAKAKPKARPGKPKKPSR